MKTKLALVFLFLCNSAFAQIPDGTARGLGFHSAEHYQQARATCARLVREASSKEGIKQCGGNMDCVFAEQNKIVEKQNKLISSWEWQQNKCDTVAQMERRR